MPLRTNPNTCFDQTLLVSCRLTLYDRLTCVSGWTHEADQSSLTITNIPDKSGKRYTFFIRSNTRMVEPSGIEPLTS